VSRLARLLPLAALASAALLAAGCGEQREVRTQGETEGLYVDSGPLTYQVQISRYLNPADVEDRSYFKGLSPGAARLTQNQVWFGVFMRVQNYTHQTQTPPAPRDFTIRDTQKNVYRPQAINTNINVFAYVQRPIVGSGVVPEPNSPAGFGPIGGALLLYKLNVASTQNRPLELHIAPPEGREAFIDLDV
jgi:hypothetical protein